MTIAMTSHRSSDANNSNTAGLQVENFRDCGAELRLEGGRLCGSEVNALDGLHDLSHDQRRRGYRVIVRSRFIVRGWAFVVSRRYLIVV